MSPLYQAQKDKEFVWNEACEKAFVHVKEEMSSEQFLTHFNPSLEIKLVCDASSVGVGAVLLHVFPDGSERPVSFASRVLSRAEKLIQ